MANPLTPKFKIGDKVKEKGLPNSEGGKILRFSYNSDSGFRYQFESKEVDIIKKEIIYGVKSCLQDELEVFDKKKETVLKKHIRKEDGNNE